MSELNLNNLRQRHRHKSTTRIKVGDIVLVKQTKKLAVVLKRYLGKDIRVRLIETGKERQYPPWEVSVIDDPAKIVDHVNE